MSLLNLKNWQIHKSVLSTFIFISPLISSGLMAQFQEVEFFNRVNSIYYTLEQTDLKNFTSWLTSNIFVNSTDDFFSEEVFPLEFIWLEGNRMFFSRRPIPVIDDSIQNQTLENLQMSMRKELKAILLDWQRFYAGRLLQNMPADYTIELMADTVILQYTTVEDTESVINTLYFGQNGICIKTSIIYPMRNESIHTYPIYKYTGEKWLCIGWKVQVLEEDDITTGYLIDIKSQRIENYWLPQIITMRLQTKREKELLYWREYYFRNILVNRNIEVMN